jgi:hypothetical protein
MVSCFITRYCCIFLDICIQILKNVEDTSPWSFVKRKRLFQCSKGICNIRTNAHLQDQDNRCTSSHTCPAVPFCKHLDISSWHLTKWTADLRGFTIDSSFPTLMTIPTKQNHFYLIIPWLFKVLHESVLQHCPFSWRFIQGVSGWTTLVLIACRGP